MNDEDDWQPASKAAQALGWIDAQTKAVSPALHLSSTFIRDPDNEYRAGYAYGRDENPAYDQAQALLAALEEGQEALLFASGLAAAVAVFQALAPGDRVVAGEMMYWGVKKWLDEIGVPWGLKVDYVETGDHAALERSLAEAPVRLVWLETPANPMWAIWEIRAAARAAHAAGALLAVDNTVATPVLTRPLQLGADLVMHSATKYLNGHSDLVAGALVAREADALWQRIRENREMSGAILGSFESWLLLRGMRTLYLRVQASSANALAVARHFAGHAQVTDVLYPGLQSFPGHEIASRQMQGGYSGMLSIRLSGGEAAAIAAAGRVKLWKRGDLSRRR